MANKSSKLDQLRALREQRFAAVPLAVAQPVVTSNPEVSKSTRDRRDYMRRFMRRKRAGGVPHDAGLTEGLI